MAEIGLIASVIQVAGAGLKLSQTLYQYADTVATADRRIKDVAKEIQLTSFVVEELGTLFKQDSTSTLLSQNALRTADETIQECSSVFQELDAALKKSKKNTLGKLMLPFRESKIELLRSHVDKLKSTLQLLMQVLTHTHQLAAQKLDREAEAAQREQLKALLKNKKNAAKRYEESLKNYSMSEGSEGSTALDSEDKSDEEGEKLGVKGGVVETATAAKLSITVDALKTCVQHIENLLSDITTLQESLEKQHENIDHSAHHQSLVGSYFRARSHLDSILLGNAGSREKTVPQSEQLNNTDLSALSRRRGKNRDSSVDFDRFQARTQHNLRDPSPGPRAYEWADTDITAVGAIFDDRRGSEPRPGSIDAEIADTTLGTALLAAELEKARTSKQASLAPQASVTKDDISAAVEKSLRELSMQAKPACYDPCDALSASRRQNPHREAFAEDDALEASFTTDQTTKREADDNAQTEKERQAQEAIVSATLKEIANQISAALADSTEASNRRSYSTRTYSRPPTPTAASQASQASPPLPLERQRKPYSVSPRTIPELQQRPHSTPSTPLGEPTNDKNRSSSSSSTKSQQDNTTFAPPHTADSAFKTKTMKMKNVKGLALSAATSLDERLGLGLEEETGTVVEDVAEDVAEREVDALLREWTTLRWGGED